MHLSVGNWGDPWNSQPVRDLCASETFQFHWGTPGVLSFGSFHWGVSFHHAKTEKIGTKTKSARNASCFPEKVAICKAAPIFCNNHAAVHRAIEMNMKTKILCGYLWTCHIQFILAMSSPWHLIGQESEIIAAMLRLVIFCLIHQLTTSRCNLCVAEPGDYTMITALCERICRDNRRLKSRSKINSQPVNQRILHVSPCRSCIALKAYRKCIQTAEICLRHCCRCRRDLKTFSIELL